ncbi:MAG: hypothetical protein LBQ88_16880 [Treponema sp.]|jgi:hypothetical protein|nr:hypothetical protein [Treponema sp.]
MAKKLAPEIHAYLDGLCESGFYGNLTLYFQDGDINNYRETVGGGKNELIERYRIRAAGGGRKKRAVLVSAIPPQGLGV